MKKILVADDERFIRLGIEALINDYFDNVEITLAKNGEEAYEECLQNDYDIVITDIHMPKLSGIEFIKKLFDTNIDVKVIVLSGFNEFEYARQCMKYGVKNYLLKPIENSELVNLIKEIFSTIDEEHGIEKHDLLRELEFELENKEKNNQNLNKLLTKLDLNFEKYKCYYIQGNIDFKEIKSSNPNSKLSFIEHEKNSGYLISNQKLNINENYDFIIESNLETELVKAFESVKELRKYKMIIGKQIITPEDIKHRKYVYVNPDNISDISDISDYLKMGKFDLIEIIVKKVFNDKNILEYNYRTYKEIHGHFIRNIFEKLGEHSNEISSLNKEFENLDFPNIGEYIENLLSVLRNLANILNENSKMEKVYIEQAKEYLNAHYNEDLNMAVVSNYVSLNYSYFSSLFKKYMKVNFLDYLNSIRIEKSKEYLKKIDYKIYEISDLVGYKNPKHFSKIFKKMEKITPIEYRLKYMER